jgi:hypothetical protein
VISTTAPMTARLSATGSSAARPHDSRSPAPPPRRTGVWKKTIAIKAQVIGTSGTIVPRAANDALKRGRGSRTGAAARRLARVSVTPAFYRTRLRGRAPRVGWRKLFGGPGGPRRRSAAAASACGRIAAPPAAPPARLSRPSAARLWRSAAASVATRRRRPPVARSPASAGTARNRGLGRLVDGDACRCDEDWASAVPVNFRGTLGGRLASSFARRHHSRDHSPPSLPASLGLA